MSHAAIRLRSGVFAPRTRSSSARRTRRSSATRPSRTIACSGRHETRGAPSAPRADPAAASRQGRPGRRADSEQRSQGTLQNGAERGIFACGGGIGYRRNPGAVSRSLAVRRGRRRSTTGSPDARACASRGNSRHRGLPGQAPSRASRGRSSDIWRTWPLRRNSSELNSEGSDSCGRLSMLPSRRVTVSTGRPSLRRR